jgi:hypothetical protein
MAGWGSAETFGYYGNDKENCQIGRMHWQSVLCDSRYLKVALKNHDFDAIY